MKRDMNDLDLSRAFRPMPQECQRALSQAVRSVKEDEPVRKTALRTVILTALIIVTLMAAAYAAMTSGLVNWFETQWQVTLPQDAQKQLEETAHDTLRAGPVSFTLEGLMADGQIAYLGVSARPVDNTGLILWAGSSDLNDPIGETLAKKWNLKAENTFLEAAEATGFPLYGVMAWIQPEGDVMGGEEMMDSVYQTDGSLLLVDMLYTDPVKVGESLKGQAVLWAYEMDPATGERRDEGFRVTREMEIKISGVKDEKTYAPQGENKLGPMTLLKVVARSTAAGVYVDLYLEGDGKMTLMNLMETMAFEVRDGQGIPFPAGISFTSQYLDSEGQEALDWEKAVETVIYRTMITADAPPQSLTIESLFEAEGQAQRAGINVN